MEQYDDLAAGPDDNGLLNLSHNTWRSLPPELSEFRGLLHIDMTNNQLSTIPESIGNLILLQTLNVSLNQIETISSGIGRCIRLRKLNVAKNRIAALPPEIGNCILLEEINANENHLTSLPQDILSLFVISVIDVRNNRLTSVPTELSRQPTLTKLLCDGNPQLSSAPENMRGDSNLLLFCLSMQQKFKDAIGPKESQHSHLQAQNDKLHHDLSNAKNRIRQLEKGVSTLVFERPDRYIYLKGRFMEFICYVLGKLNRLWEMIKGEFGRWRDRKKTHPLY